MVFSRYFFFLFFVKTNDTFNKTFQFPIMSCTGDIKIRDSNGRFFFSFAALLFERNVKYFQNGLKNQAFFLNHICKRIFRYFSNNIASLLVYYYRSNIDCYECDSASLTFEFFLYFFRII